MRRKIFPIFNGKRTALRRKVDHSVIAFANPQFKSQKQKEMNKLEWTYIQNKLWKHGAKNVKILRKDEERVTLTVAIEDILLDCV